MSVADILKAMRADSIPAGVSGRWEVRKSTITPEQAETYRRLEKKGRCKAVPPGDYTWLFLQTMATMMQDHGETVMNDFDSELRKHLEFIMKARGRVLVTGLGLGCVVRGLLARGKVDSIDVIERSPDVIKLCGKSVADPRVTVHHRDALDGWLKGEWDYGWHDIHSDPEKNESHLQVLHMQLFSKFIDQVKYQGCWAMPRRFLRGGLEKYTLKAKNKGMA